MNWNNFDNISALEESLLISIERDLGIETKTSDQVLVLLSGGLTPLSLYKRFKEITSIDWSKVKFGLVDERWVSIDSNESNFYNISKALGKDIISKATLTSLVYDLNNEDVNLSEAKSENSDFLNQKAIVLLGMGLDGNIASLFPKTSQTDDALSQIHPDISLNLSQSNPEKRITHNLKSILNTKKIVLFVQGMDKKKVLKDAKKELLPISYILNTFSTQVDVFWTK
jgi:6-phosphogluconolactonase